MLADDLVEPAVLPLELLERRFASSAFMPPYFTQTILDSGLSQHVDQPQGLTPVSTGAVATGADADVPQLSSAPGGT